MNKTEVVLAIVILAGIVAGVGYGAYYGYEYISMQWSSLGGEWRSVLIIAGAMLGFCTLFLSLTISSSMKKYGLRGTGKVLVYKEFFNWYSELKINPDLSGDPKSFRQIANQLIIWGNEKVAHKVVRLFDLLQDKERDKDKILEEANMLYTEIRGDLGLGSTSGDEVIRCACHAK